MGCNETKHTCGTTNYSTCIVYESEVNAESSLVSEACLDQDKVDQDQFNQLGKIWKEIDLSDLGNKCLSYVQENGKNIVRNVLLEYETEICTLKEEVEFLKNRKLCDIPISECITDFNCLVGQCDSSIVTLKDWMIAVQNKIC